MFLSINYRRAIELAVDIPGAHIILKSCTTVAAPTIGDIIKFAQLQLTVLTFLEIW
jgi:hypothetical protein